MFVSSNYYESADVVPYKFMTEGFPFGTLRVVNIKHN